MGKLIFWGYSALIIALALRTFWLNLMILTQAPFKVRWIFFMLRHWRMRILVRRFLKAVKARENSADSASCSTRLPPPLDP